MSAAENDITKRLREVKAGNTEAEAVRIETVLWKARRLSMHQAHESVAGIKIGPLNPSETAGPNLSPAFVIASILQKERGQRRRLSLASICRCILGRFQTPISLLKYSRLRSALANAAPAVAGSMSCSTIAQPRKLHFLSSSRSERKSTAP
jgi:hypothetical protein